jgi:pimeloyl-ACP methyl ester carboxylesterase
MTFQFDRGNAERFTVDLPQRHIAALRSGPADDDTPTALLVPGYTGSKEDFAPLLDRLATARSPAVAIDLPGQFESPAMDSTSDYRPDALGAVVRDVARALDSPVRLLGHSFGGLVARAAVIAEPDLFGSLVLLSSGPGQLDGVRRVRIDQLAPVLASSGLVGVYAAMQAAAATEPGYVAPPDELAEFLERRFLGGSPEMLAGMADALRAEPDRVAELAATGVPVLVLHGAGDDAWEPAVQREMAERLGAQYVVVPGAAHSAAVENPAATAAALLDFWRSQSPSGRRAAGSASNCS